MNEVTKINGKHESVFPLQKTEAGNGVKSISNLIWLIQIASTCYELIYIKQA